MRKLWIVVLMFVGAALAQSALAADWPQWRGVRRDACSNEKGLLKSWPASGPKLLLTIDGLGKSFSSPVVAAGRIYVTGMVGQNLKVFCFDMQGEKIWEADNGPEWAKPYPGARSTPTIDGRTLYVLSGCGRLVALDCANGKERWAVNIAEQFHGARERIGDDHGYTESLLMEGDKVICLPGGPQVGLAALDKKSGKVIWTTNLAGDPASYASPMSFIQNGERLIATFTSRRFIGVRARDGKLLYEYTQKDLYDQWKQIAMTPMVGDGIVFIGGSTGKLGCALRLEDKGTTRTVTRLWETRDLHCGHKNGLAVNGFIYADLDRDLCCLDLKTGKLLWRAKGVGGLSLAWADGMLYGMDDEGKVRLIEANPKECKVAGEFKLPNAGGQTYASPVIAGGKLFLRRHEKLFVYEIR